MNTSVLGAVSKFVLHVQHKVMLTHSLICRDIKRKVRVCSDAFKRMNCRHNYGMKRRVLVAAASIHHAT
jgi:hypothetical protein